MSPFKKNVVGLPRVCLSFFGALHAGTLCVEVAVNNVPVFYSAVVSLNTAIVWEKKNTF